MTLPDFEGAITYAHNRMRQELDTRLTYHNLAHTFDEVLPTALHLAALNQLEASRVDLLAVAAAFHDIGFIRQRDGHEQQGTKLARKILPGYGFSAEQIEAIAGMILATQLPQSPTNLSEQILADADLDVLGRDDFWPRNNDLRTERANYGDLLTDREWFQAQLEFLETHHYFTPASRALRNKQKQQYVAEIKNKLAEVASTA